jgi:hypothetical protein
MDKALRIEKTTLNSYVEEQLGLDLTPQERESVDAFCHRIRGGTLTEGFYLALREDILDNRKAREEQYKELGKTVLFDGFPRQ